MNPQTLRGSFLPAILPVAVWAGSGFRQVILDRSYIAYERDVGDADGDGDNDVVAIQEGDTALQVFRAPDGTRSALVSSSETNWHPRADDLKLADIDGDGDLDVVTRLGAGPSDGGPGIAVGCESKGGGSGFVQHLIGNSLEYVKDIVVADCDRDGRFDVAMRMDSRTQLWLQSPGRTWTEVLLAHPPHAGMDAGDLDMDGDADLLVGGMIQSQHRGLRLMLNGGKGSRWTSMVVQTEGGYSAELGDMGPAGSGSAAASSRGRSTILSATGFTPSRRTAACVARRGIFPGTSGSMAHGVKWRSFKVRDSSIPRSRSRSGAARPTPAGSVSRLFDRGTASLWSSHAGLAPGQGCRMSHAPLGQRSRRRCVCRRTRRPGGGRPLADRGIAEGMDGRRSAVSRRTAMVEPRGLLKSDTA